MEEFTATFGGALVNPSAPDYDVVRAVHNGMIDRRPALIARCHSTADVVDALRLAQRSGLEIAVRGGGHNVSGRAVCDDGIVIDLSPMKGVVVDPARKTAMVQGGVTWAEMNRETQVFGLATTGGVISSTGVAGLTLGGGLGWLMASYGMAVDNLRSAQVVTASGEVLRVAEDEHPDLFWAVRGGGGNFGIVPAFEFDLHEVGPVIVGGLVAYPLAAGREVMRAYRDFTAQQPDELETWCGLLHAPDGSGNKIVAVIACYNGDVEAGMQAVQPLRAFGTPVMDALGPMPYGALNQMFDEGFPAGVLNYWKANFLQSLSDDAIDRLLDRFAACPSPLASMMIEHFHGAVTRIPVSSTAFPHRTEGYNLVIAGVWAEPAQTDEMTSWVRGTFEAMRPHMAPGRYVNYLGEDEGDDSAADAYGENYQRLRELKRQYDPENIFHLNQNIRPA